MPWGEVVPAAQQGVIDGADLPIYNINALKVYEVSKYVSMTFHNYGPTLLVMNLDVWKSLTPEQQKLFLEVSREAQKKIRELTESVDNLAKAKEILEAKGMKVNAADVASFRKLAEDKIWPATSSSTASSGTRWSAPSSGFGGAPAESGASPALSGGPRPFID
jgi:TRAP-type C4-dicarboxylate transport system substrate-binding protein